MSKRQSAYADIAVCPLCAGGKVIEARTVQRHADDASLPVTEAVVRCPPCGGTGKVRVRYVIEIDDSPMAFMDRPPRTGRGGVSYVDR